MLSRTGGSDAYEYCSQVAWMPSPIPVTTAHFEVTACVSVEPGTDGTINTSAFVNRIEGYTNGTMYDTYFTWRRKSCAKSGISMFYDKHSPTIQIG